MAELTSKFTRDDLETLLESIGDWEMLGNQEWHLLNMIKNSPMPPEDHEAYDHMVNIKNHFRSREKEIQASRETRQEKAVFLKAKLMLVRRDMGIDQLFEMAGSTDNSIPSSSAPVEKVPESTEPVKVPVKDASGSKGLELAEFFIKDLGVWDHYQKFLSEQS